MFEELFMLEALNDAQEVVGIMKVECTNADLRVRANAMLLSDSRYASVIAHREGKTLFGDSCWITVYETMRPWRC